MTKVHHLPHAEELPALAESLDGVHLAQASGSDFVETVSASLDFTSPPRYNDPWRKEVGICVKEDTRPYEAYT